MRINAKSRQATPSGLTNPILRRAWCIGIFEDFAKFRKLIRRQIDAHFLHSAKEDVEPSTFAFGEAELQHSV
jgi:hypothetical protein